MWFFAAGNERLSIEKKIEILNKHEEGKIKCVSLADNYKVHKSTITRILKNKNEIKTST